MSLQNGVDRATEMEMEQGRATRARTRLIVEGFSNLALVAILFTGVQAQLISVANDSNDQEPNNLSIATNAVFFGGLIFSVFTTMLATLSGRWFSILREDDSDYLSSCWLAQDCAELAGDKPDLEKYLDYQIKSIEKDIKKQLQKTQTGSARSSNVPPLRQSSAPESPDANTSNPDANGGNSTIPPQLADNNAQADTDRIDISHGDPDIPMVRDLERIILLLRAEKESGVPPASSKSEGSTRREILKSGKTTVRERILSVTLLSALAASVAAFLLFCAGILLLAWNTQPRAVAIFTSATVLVCVVPLLCFFLRHRHKHVIKHLHLGRPRL